MPSLFEPYSGSNASIRCPNRCRSSYPLDSLDSITQPYSRSANDHKTPQRAGAIDIHREVDYAGRRTAKTEIVTTSDLLEDTYVAALQHDLVDISPEATLVGVVRRPTGWFRTTINENYPALGPPPDLLDEFKQRHEDFKMQGMCDEGAHNAAWDEAGFEDRYRTHLTEAADAQEAVAELTNRLRDGENLVFVCFENTDQKRCHRTLLKEHITEQL